MRKVRSVLMSEHRETLMFGEVFIVFDVASGQRYPVSEAAGGDP